MKLLNAFLICFGCSAEWNDNSFQNPWNWAVMASTRILEIFGSNRGRDTDHPDLRVCAIFRSSSSQMLNFKKVHRGPHLTGSLFNTLFRRHYFHLRVVLSLALCTSFCSAVTYISPDDQTQWQVPIRSCSIDLPERPVFSFPIHYTLGHLCDLGSEFFMRTVLRCLSVMLIYREIICSLSKNMAFSLVHTLRWLLHLLLGQLWSMLNLQ